MPDLDQQSGPVTAGRAQRLEEKRRHVVRSALDLIIDGELNPTIQQVVERSGVPERTIFRYFDKGELSMQVFQLALTDLADDFLVPELGVGSFEERVANIVATRIHVLEHSGHLARVARLRAGVDPEIGELLLGVLDSHRGKVQIQFGAELDPLDDDERRRRLDLATTLLTFDNFDVMRRQLGNSLDDIRAAWAHALVRILT